MLKREKGGAREGGEKRVGLVYSVYLVGPVNKRDKKNETDNQVTDEQELLAIGQTSRQGAQGRAWWSSGSAAPAA